MEETHIFFIRHGESVDDVSHGHAGPPDSPLTAHGAIQSSQLAAHLAERAASLAPIPHMLCSDFQQARMTAEAIRDAYPSPAAGSTSTVKPEIAILQLGELREKRFGERSAEVSDSAAAAQPGGGAYTEGESFKEVDARAKRFLDAVLLPLLEELLTSGTPQCVFIIAHGVIHSHVWLEFIRLLRALRPRTTSAPGAMCLESVPLDEFLGNAAYHEIVLKTPTLSSEDSSSSQSGGAGSIDQALSTAQVHFSAINYADHLSGLKKTGGGIGNAKYDKKQRKIDSFFSKSSA
ncbi:histidine phosphatase superfamily [Lasiosphaeria ovina]|uniref:Histidine phosphatase superfamily n=1 Tax=Lasiosphaeria ovina TaxID=92902 RepID=A0AAE0JUW3_9PEZI|nr:histidine phosphatase superfamily [Lasiosphaeria ovina]KAK3365373.1 histidine phosphatase superfamily [Lasiosphaeria ovina]